MQLIERQHAPLPAGEHRDANIDPSVDFLGLSPRSSTLDEGGGGRRRHAPEPAERTVTALHQFVTNQLYTSSSCAHPSGSCPQITTALGVRST